MKIVSKMLNLKKKEISSFINDRRNRKRYEVPLKLIYKDPSTNSEHESLTKNISRAGLRFSVSNRIEKGTTIELNIEDPNTNKFISSLAKVMWIEEFVAGDNADKIIYEIGVRLAKKKLF
ncbi:MAG: PilZ domain-containing protein [Candidatus Omnitrophota bacterium]